MAKRRIGALVIGQSPRPDLVEPLAALLPDAEIVQAGALDGVEADDIPSADDTPYPLSTRLRNGRLIHVTQAAITPLLKKQLDQLEADGVDASILLCAGTFAALIGRRPLFKPFTVGLGLVHSFGWKRIGLIAPFAKQEAPIEARWRGAGFETAVWSANLAQQDAHFIHNLHHQITSHNLQALILDYVGHPTEQVRQLQEASPVPVIDLGEMTMRVMAAGVRE